MAVKFLGYPLGTVRKKKKKQQLRVYKLIKDWVGKYFVIALSQEICLNLWYKTT